MLSMVGGEQEGIKCVGVFVVKKLTSESFIYLFIYFTFYFIFTCFDIKFQVVHIFFNSYDHHLPNKVSNLKLAKLSISTPSSTLMTHLSTEIHEVKLHYHGIRSFLTKFEMGVEIDDSAGCRMPILTDISADLYFLTLIYLACIVLLNV